MLGEVPAPTAPPGAPAPAPEGSAAAVAPTSPGERSAGPPLGAWLLAGGGVALGLGGVGAFVAAGSESHAAAEACAAGRCDEGARSTVQALDRVALGLWIGGALAIGGAGLWWALSDDAAVSAAVRPGGGALRARF